MVHQKEKHSTERTRLQLFRFKRSKSQRQAEARINELRRAEGARSVEDKSTSQNYTILVRIGHLLLQNKQNHGVFFILLVYVKVISGKRHLKNHHKNINYVIMY